MRLRLAIVCAVACALVVREAASQDGARGFAAVRGDAIFGSVLDPNGKPIAGASISLAAVDNHDGPVEFQQAALHQLRYTRMPSGRTGADGGFNLALTRDQARLGILGGLQMLLAVEKDGFWSWRGPIGTCPGRAGGISVRLASRDPGDLITGVVLLPEGREGRPAGRIDVVYDARPAWRDGPASTSSVLVGGGDSFTVPRRCDVLEQCATWGWNSELRSVGFHLWPAFEGFADAPAWFPREAGRFAVRLVAAGDPHAPVTVQLAEGATRPAELTVLYRSREFGWWRRTVPFGPVRTMGTWRPHAIEAAGFSAAEVAWDSGRKTGTATLVALPREPVRLRIAGKDGAAVAGAEVEVVELTERTVVGRMAIDAGGRPALRSRSATDGGVDLPPELFARVHYLSVQAAGHEPFRPIELAQCVAAPRIDLVPIPAGRLRLLVKHDGEPVDGASVFFGNETWLRGAIPGPPPTTGMDGTLTAVLPAGKHLVAVFSETFALESVECDVRQGAVHDLVVQLVKSGGAHVRLVDGGGKPLVRKPVAWRTRSEERPVNYSAHSYTDEQGRARLDGLPPELGDVVLMTPGFMCPNTHDGIPRMDAPGAVELAATDGEVRLRVPPGLEELGIAFQSGGGRGMTSRFRAHGAGEFRFRKGASAPGLLVLSPLLPVLPQVLAAADEDSIDLRMTDWPEVLVDCELDGADPAELRVVHMVPEPKRWEGDLAGAGTDLARIWRKAEDGPARVRFRVPPKGSFDVELQHSQFVPQPLGYVDGKGPQGVVRMKRGAALKLAFPRAAADLRKASVWRSTLSVELTTVAGGEKETRAIPITVTATGEEHRLEVGWPYALAPGSYTLRIRAFPLSRFAPSTKRFTVKGIEPVTLEFLRTPAPARDR